MKKTLGTFKQGTFIVQKGLSNIMTTINKKTKFKEFKEFDTTKEFEYSGYEYELETCNTKYLLYCDFFYSPNQDIPSLKLNPESYMTNPRNAYVALINVYLGKESKEDIYYLLDDTVIREIETGILQDLLG